MRMASWVEERAGREEDMAGWARRKKDAAAAAAAAASSPKHLVGLLFSFCQVQNSTLFERVFFLLPILF
jgi:hypothetical protein